MENIECKHLGCDSRAYAACHVNICDRLWHLDQIKVIHAVNGSSSVCNLITSEKTRGVSQSTPWLVNTKKNIFD